MAVSHLYHLGFSEIHEISHADAHLNKELLFDLIRLNSSILYINSAHFIEIFLFLNAVENVQVKIYIHWFGQIAWDGNVYG
ncbi:hypothetical protein BKP44_14650 [Formosa algae]|nr:hypothetical protein BKP44_14650 [Formosa algae]